MSRPTPISGFPELLPEQRYAELTVLDRLRRVFELHGFASVETRAVEPLEQLLRKGETSKEIYLLRRLQADQEPAGSSSGGGAADALGLHYDLTVPFARYVLENAGKLEFPFRRYQVQRAWRGERPQEGRFREFTQADIDIVGRDSLAFHHDVEVALVMAEALSGLPFLPPLTLHVNNRKLLQGFYSGLGVADVDAVLRIVDKLDKLPAEAVASLLAREAGLSDEQARGALRLAEIRSDDLSFVDEVTALGVSSPLLEEGIEELAAVVAGCAAIPSSQVRVEANLRIARGLDYYTGTVYETTMSGHEHLGSICSGGRYDHLATDGRITYPGVGISLGVSRLLLPLLQRGALTASRPVPSAVMVAVTAEDTRRQSDAVAQALRGNGIPTEVAASAVKFGRQIRYAERRGIPFVWFPGADGGSGEVKDIRSGDQTVADPHTWRPPEADLFPTIAGPQETS